MARTPAVLWQKLKLLFITGMRDSLHRNSYLLMLSTAIMSGFGCLFWLICAKLFTPEEVGLATSLISAAALLTNLSFLGFTNTLVRFLPRAANKSAFVSTALIVTSAAAVGVSAIFLIGLHFFAPHLAALNIPNSYWGILCAYVVIATASAMLDSLFIAERNAQLVLAKNTLFSVVKVGLPFALIGLGMWGIFMATAIGMAAGLALSIYFAYRRGLHLQLKLDKEVIVTTRRFAGATYAANVFGALPATVLPLLVATKLSAEAAAYFYMPMMIATLLTVIPSASAQSLLAEASHAREHTRRHVIETLKGTFTLLLPCIALVALGGGLILQVFGKQYSTEGLVLLQLLAVASIFGALNYIGDTVLTIRKDMRGYLAMNAINAGLVLGLVYAGMIMWQLTGVGVGWLVAQLVTVIIFASWFGRQELRRTAQN